MDTLTVDGCNFLPAVDHLISHYSDGYLDVYGNNGDDVALKVRSTFSYGKHLLLPCITRMHDSGDLDDSGIELMTNKNVSKIGSVDSHIVFKNLMAMDRLFFEHKWSLQLEQGLFASEGYLVDTGNYPKKIEDLSSHSILGYGETFDQDTYRILNWHLIDQYKLEPSMLISSPSVIIAAVEANLGIGPVIYDHEKFGYDKLFRIIPEVSGPPVTLDFAVRRKLSGKLREMVENLEILLLSEIERMGLKIAFVGFNKMAGKKL
jgi:DNA-binding transcriptional LysR family regulator